MGFCQQTDVSAFEYAELVSSSDLHQETCWPFLSSSPGCSRPGTNWLCFCYGSSQIICDKEIFLLICWLTYQRIGNGGSCVDAVDKINAASVGQIEVFITYLVVNDLQQKAESIQLRGSKSSSHPSLQGPISERLYFSYFWNKIHLFQTEIVSP